MQIAWPSQSITTVGSICQGGEAVSEIDPGKLADEARCDGIFVLRTHAKIKTQHAVLRYRDLF